MKSRIVRFLFQLEFWELFEKAFRQLLSNPRGAFFEWAIKKQLCQLKKSKISFKIIEFSRVKPKGVECFSPSQLT